ncbi:MAG: hypothetical protein ABW046_22785, partial [Actinoplanes sp.]
MTDIQVVRGEIQPWTDYPSSRHPAGGAALLAFLDDVLPASAARTLVAGPHSVEVLRLVAARSEHLTVLIRSVSDATDLREALPGDSVTIVTGALDGYTAAPFDVVLAVDGLDRVLGADSDDLNWPQRADLLRALTGPGTLLLVGVENEFALTALYDRRPVDARHGDDEWRPLHDDPARPTSPEQVIAALPTTRLYASFDSSAGVTHTLLDVAAAADTRPGRLGAILATAGLAAAETPLLAPVSDGAAAAARAGLLGAVAPGWLAVCGPAAATHTAYTPTLRLDLGDDGWTVGDRTIGDVETVETTLFRLAAAEDVPAFRAYADRLGLADGVFRLDDLFPYGESWVTGIVAVPADATRTELLAAAWFRFRDRLIAQHRRHPWPPWMVEGDDLVTTWLAMSGVEATPELLKRGRELAPSSVEDLSLLDELADADADRLKAKEMAGRIFGLERTLRFRDQSLKTREAQIRKMRDDLRRFRNSPAMKLHEVARKA